ncbi:unnamed protein product [Plutella xylostella]|uniref:(diamondback moth) hypothetical protein n=1 Tax=Plutella xylostella TaxID=51655 RepID=A0A8S4F5U9_PLUXY|nr:unnamed protein product [Plutella xylostella]
MTLGNSTSDSPPKIANMFNEFFGSVFEASDTALDTIDLNNITQSEAKVISLPYIDSISRKPQFLPLTVPKDLAARVLKFNGDPAAWWIGQVLKFILRPRPEMQRAINETIAKMNFQRPIVGIHIRRTDKVGAEAAFHHIHEYMKHVKQYYDKLQLSTDVRARRVYIATDDPNALSDARSKYPDYTFHGDPSIAKTAAHRRYTPLSLTGLLVDLQLLSSCDYIVCTFSSQTAAHRRYTPLSLTGLLVDLQLLSSCDYIVCTFSSQTAAHRRYTPLSLTGLLVDLQLLSSCDYIVCTFSSQTAAHRRYTPLSLTGLLVDLQLLSSCDYIVCTFSSQTAAHRRYTPLSLTGLLVDLQLLSSCDYIVCTFSSQTAAHRRYTPLSLTGLLVDLQLLSSCDYIVCTFSSQTAAHRRYTPLSLTGLLVDLQLLSSCDYIVCTFSSQTAAHRRYTPLSLTGLLVDLQLLSSCDYIVCTFSSQTAAHRRYTPLSLTGLLVYLQLLSSCDYIVCTFSSQTAAHRRYTPLSLTGLLVDLQLLSSCDYIVCTFSSQIGRLAYEMMQANRADASNSYFTLDDIYYYGGQNAHNRIAVLPHKGGKHEDISFERKWPRKRLKLFSCIVDDIYYYGGQNAHNRIAVLPHKGGKHEDISFEVGDFIGVAGNHWNGYGRGTNKKTNQDGLIPWYKTADHLVMYAFPEYKQVPLYKGQKIDPDT